MRLGRLPGGAGLCRAAIVTALAIVLCPQSAVRGGQSPDRSDDRSLRDGEPQLIAAAPSTAPPEIIIVTGRRPDAASVRAPTSSVTVIDTSERNDEPVTVTDVLADTVGVQVRRFGGLGAFSTISIRGSTSNQVRFYLDGIPLSRARNETVNLADFPLDSLARIEIYRGTVPVGFGAGAIAGAVNLVTKPPSAEPQTELGASYGSFATRKIIAAHTRAVRTVSLLGYLTYVGSEGDFSFFDDNNTPFQPADDRTTTRRNSAFNSIDALLKGSWTLANDLQLDLTSETFFKDQGVPGPDSPQARATSLRESRSLNYLRASRLNLFGGTTDLSATLFGVVERTAFEDPKGELGIGNVDRLDTDTVVGANASGTYAAQPTQATGWFVEILHDRFAGTNRLAVNPDEPDQTRLNLALALQHQATLLNERVLLIPTIRYEHIRDEVSASFDLANQPSGPRQTQTRDLWSPSVGAQLGLQPWLFLRGNIGRFQRAPNFSELFGARGVERGNPELRDETGINRDLGLVAATAPAAWLDGARLEYTYFENDYDDLIVFVNSGFRDVRPVNIGAAGVRGHEVAFAATAFDHLQLGGNYTHQDAADRSDRRETRGKKLPGRPADELYTRLEGFTELASLYYEFNYVGPNFLVRSNFLQAPSRSIHTLGLTVRPRVWLSLNFEARNLTDDRIRDIADFPLPGRSFFGTVRVRF